MDIILGSTVRCVEGFVGDVARLVLHSHEEHLTSIVVRRAVMLRREIVVDLGLIERSGKGIVYLRCLKAEIAGMKRFSHPGSVVWGQVASAADVWDNMASEDIPFLRPAEQSSLDPEVLILDPRTRVRATNGSAGRSPGAFC